MLEGGAKELGEEDVVQGINLALESMRSVMDLQDQMQKAIGKAKRNFAPPSTRLPYRKISDLVKGGFRGSLPDPRETRPLRKARTSARRPSPRNYDHLNRYGEKRQDISQLTVESTPVGNNLSTEQNLSRIRRVLKL